MWYDHAAQRGGHAASGFVQASLSGKFYPEAVTMLLGWTGRASFPIAKQEPEPQEAKAPGAAEVLPDYGDVALTSPNTGASTGMVTAFAGEAAL